MGIITNEFAAPKPFEWACNTNSWPPNPSRLYVTQLFAPPMQRYLTLNHYDDIVNDCIDYYYRILGSATHSMIEKAAKGRVGVQTEVRVAAPKEWFGMEITGRIDWIDYIDSILADIKTASVGIYGRGIKEDWVYQANIYRYFLARLHGYTAERLMIYPLYRDWSPGKAGHDHPISPFGEIELPVWTMDETEKFIERKVAENMVEGKPRFCTDEERWKTPDCFAVKKEGQAKAVAATMYIDDARVPIPTRELAQSIIDSKKSSAGLYIEERKGGCRRCSGYCDVSTVCKKVNVDFWKEN